MKEYINIPRNQIILVIKKTRKIIGKIKNFEYKNPKCKKTNT
jgi:hypothetical protein